MRMPRGWMLEGGCRHFHCLSRVVDRQFVFGKEEREMFRRILRKVEAFSGVEVLTWTMLSNHFHLLVHVPDPVKLTDAELLKRVAKLYGTGRAREVKLQLEEWKGPHFAAARDELRQRYLSRMFDLSEFMKTLKQRFSIWFNRSRGRKGTLWEERFKSVAVGGGWEAILTVAAYIDLNCVRAGLAGDPKDYRWCGYAEAVAGHREARRGLGQVFEEEGQPVDWRHTSGVYRSLLFGVGEESPGKRGFDRAKVKMELERGGHLSRNELLRCRVRYFADGTALGTREFVEAFYQARRDTFGPSRSSGARKMRGGDWGNLASLRDLRLAPVQLE